MNAVFIGIDMNFVILILCGKLFEMMINVQTELFSGGNWNSS